MIVWIIFAVVLAAALIVVLWPLLRPRVPAASRADFDIEVYLDQLRELDRDVARELIDETQAAAARLEIERRLLAASRSAEQPADPPRAIRRWPLAALLAVAISAATLALYIDLGSPGLPNQPFAERARAENPQIAQARAGIQAIEARLADAPADADLWRDLGRLRLAAGEDAGAVAALAQAMTLSGERADIASAYGEALTFAAEGMVTPQAQRVFSKVLREDPGEPRAQFFMALANYQAGRLEAALDLWAALARDAPGDAAWLPVVADRIRRTAAELGVDVRAYLPALPGPTGDDVAAAAELTPAEQQEMIRGMVGQLASRLESEPGDVEGWRRLAQSYTVLEEPGRAADAYANALALEPDHPETLLRAGLAAARAGDRATALGYFEHLRSLIPPDSAAHRSVSEAIERLSDDKTTQ